MKSMVNFRNSKCNEKRASIFIDPTSNARLTVWEIVHHFIRVRETGGEGAQVQIPTERDLYSESEG